VAVVVFGIAYVAAGCCATAEWRTCPAGTAPASATTATASSRALVTRYCVSCHNDKLKTGGLALDALDIEKVGDNVAAWEKPCASLHVRAHAPAGPGRPRPDEAGYESLISYLETSLDRAAAERPNPGRTDTFHRLNRTEYQNAVRDLLALDIDAASLLPTDDSKHGFDNVNVGGLSPTLLDATCRPRRKSAGSLSGAPCVSPGENTVVLPVDLTQNDQLDGLPFGTRGGTSFRQRFR